MATPTALFLATAFQLLIAMVMSEHINFYNVRPPVDATPYPKSFKCFTCEQASDNYNCNRWAEDKWCPQNTQYCMSVHHFSHHERTQFVTKRCATREACRSTGCRHYRDTRHTECVSCCEGMVCNVEVPTNHSNAVFSRRWSPSSAGPALNAWAALTFLAALLGRALPL